MVKKFLVFCIILSVFVGALFGGGRKDNESRSSDDVSGFTDSFDLDNRKVGKWNFYIEATDRAGNVNRAGPDNVFNDPESDLPRVTIINPQLNMRIQGNVNIVGIATDDDAVDEVWIKITRGADGRGEELVNVKAEGKDYWSYFLNTTDQEIWKDGVYSITAWAIDVNGLSGISSAFPVKKHKTHTIYFHLDRKKPDITVTSHEIGELVAGRVRLRGSVYDGNGIADLSYSIDDGQRYTPIRFREDRRSGNSTFELDLDSKKVFEDGPAVIWFQATDGQGSVGTSAHLLFVNNTGPEVRIVYPTADTVVNGVFSVAGYSSHPVGVKSVTWKAGKQSGAIELFPGNHWWSFNLDTRTVRDSSIDIEIRAEDVSGNVTTVKQRYRMNQTADLPTVRLTSPVTSEMINPDIGIIVKGTAADDDAVASVLYSLNGGAAVEIPASGAFQFVIPTPDEGASTVEVWAKDVTGVTGPRVAVRNILSPSGLPEPRIASFQTGSGSSGIFQPFYTGVRVALQQRVRTNMEVAIKAAALTSATVTFGEQPPVTIRPGSPGRDGLMRATVQVPANLPSGFTKIDLTATDRLGRDVTFSEYVFIEQSDTSIFSSYDPFQNWFMWIRPQMSGNRIVLSSPDEKLIGQANLPVDYAELRGAGASNLRTEVDEYGHVLLSAINEGTFGPFTLTLGTFTSQQFTILADFGPPQVTITQPPAGFNQNSAQVGFNVASNNRVTAVDYSIDMGANWQSLLSSSDAGGIRGPSNPFTRTVNLTNAEDGSVGVLIRASSESGKTSITSFSALKDTTAPVGTLIMPITEARVNGTIRMGFDIKENAQLKTVTYRRGGTSIVVYDVENWTNDYQINFLEVMMDSNTMPLDNNMRFAFEDMAGNRSEVSTWDFIIDQEMDIPIVHVILPLENEVITADFIVSGIMFDDDGIKNVRYRIDNTAERIIEAANGFSIFVPLSSLADNEHTITVTAEDIYGVRSAPVTRAFRVSLSEPAAALTYPMYDTVVRDSLELRGTSSDANGIDAVYISVDNGNTYNRATGTTNWTYRFNTTILKDGPHVVFIKAVDRYEIPATYANMINIDNTDPFITLDSPHDGSLTTQAISVMGRVEDPNLDEVTLQVRSLSGQNVRSDLRSQSLGTNTIVRQTLDFTGMSDGFYNIEITGRDKAGNITRASRNFELARQSISNYVEILYPLTNQQVSGEFILYGYAGGLTIADTVTVRINGTDVLTNEVEESGYWRFVLNTEHFNVGANAVVVYSNFGNGPMVQSRPHSLVYNEAGPWVTIDSFNFGQFAYSRPYLFGRNGYQLSEEDRQLLADRATPRNVKDEIQNKVPDYTEISFDNGKTFRKTSKSRSKGQDYRFRLETGEMAEGIHYILVRTIMKNGEIAVTRMIVQVDKTLPQIRLISPEAGGLYNQEMLYSASATDDIELTSLTYHLRVGDKALYEVPGILKGMYFESVIPPWPKMIFTDVLPNVFAGGATFMDIGFGLSFFDDNVKIQLQYGFLTRDLYQQLGGEGDVRYGGDVLGLKLLASVYALQFGPILGPDWEWLSLSVALGANFSYFDVTHKLQGEDSRGDPVYYTQSGSATWLSALLLQVEFPKVTLPDRKNFRTFSFFTEAELWFVPTDVDASANNIPVILPKFITGLRIYIF